MPPSLSNASSFSSGPLKDPQRSKALDRYDALDTLPNDFFDRITRLAAHLFHAPTAYVTFVEVNRTRSMTDLGSDESSRPGITFCMHALRSDGVMVVEDATEDDRFAGNPFVTGDPRIRFYAGTPLVTPDGFSIGTLCVMDTEPQSPSSEAIHRLEDLAKVVVEEMELRRETALRRTGDRQRLQTDIFEQIAAGESAFGIESLIERSDGSERLILINGAPLYDEDEMLVGAVFHRHDITKQRQAEAALRRSQKKYKALFDSSTDAIIVHDLSGNILDANRKAKSLFQMSIGELEDQTLFDLHTTEAEQHAEQKLAALHEGQSFHTATQYVRKDGSVFWGEVSANVADVDEDVTWSMIRNVTGRKEATESLREREARLRGLANSIPGVIFQFFVQPHGRRGLHFANEQLGSVLGMSETDPNDAFDRFLERIPETHRDAIRTSIETAIDEEALWTEEFPFEKSPEETIWIQGIATPEKAEVELVFNGVLLDNTAHKRTQQQLQQAQKMETVGTLAGGIAHDFNNMLHAATAYIDMAAEKVPNEHSVQALLSRAKKGLDQTEDLICKLLTFARPDTEARRERIDIASLVRDALDLAEPSFPSALSARVNLDENGTVIGNPDQLLQVVVNLIRNAVQAMTEHDPEPVGEHALVVHLQKVKVGTDLTEKYLNLEPGCYVHLAVSDTGPGMDEATRQRIFDPFFTTKKPEKGTGLGLAVVHGAVQAHEGTINVQTALGEGTTVNVYLSDADNRADESADDLPRPQENNEDVPFHILVVDDDESVRELETVRLGKLGYRVSTRPSANAALEAIRSNPDAYDLAITDYGMSQQTGLQLTRQLREQGFTRPIVLMSGFSAQVSDEDALQAGVDGILQKPVGTDEIDALLTDLFPDSEA